MMERAERSAIDGPPPTIRIYGRPDCHLCDEALAGLESLRAEGLEFELKQVDIESDQALLRRYLERIPVIELNGVVVDELALDVDGLRSRLGTVSS